MKIYISTPINGRKEATFEEKREAARTRVEALKALAMPLTPGEGDSAISTFDINPDGVTEGEAMAQCIRTIIDECDAVLMDAGWKGSRGCTVEFHTAKAYGKLVFCLDLRRSRQQKLRMA